MHCQDLDAGFRKTTPPRGIQGALRGGNHRSSADQATNFIKHLLARDSLNLTGADFISTPNRFCDPELLNLIDLLRLQALYELVSQQDSRGDWKLHCFLRQLFKC